MLVIRDELSGKGDYVNQGAILRARPRPYPLRRPLLGYVRSNGTRQYDAVNDHGLPDAFTVLCQMILPDPTRCSLGVA